MARLDPAQQASRRAFDYRVVRGMKGDSLGSVRAFGSHEDLRAGRDISEAEAEAGRAALYVVGYRFPILTGPGATMNGAMVLFDIAASDNYPFTPPLVTVISRPLPWSPHVQGTSGAVCLGNAWTRASGSMLLSGLVVHVARTFNMDEEDRGDHYVGWNAPAITYWRTVLNRKPVNPELVYPVLPVDITHGLTNKPDGGFRAAAVQPAFRPVSLPASKAAAVQAEAAGGFRAMKGAR